jgi:hypothetical protein
VISLFKFLPPQTYGSVLPQCQVLSLIFLVTGQTTLCCACANPDLFWFPGSCWLLEGFSASSRKWQCQHTVNLSSEEPLQLLTLRVKSKNLFFSKLMSKRIWRRLWAWKSDLYAKLRNKSDISQIEVSPACVQWTPALELLYMHRWRSTDQ